MARQIVKQQPIVRTRTVKIGYFHAHGCLACGRRYQDTCSFARKNNLCPTCAKNQPLTQEDRDRLPRDCCANGGSRLITDIDELSKYNLGGELPWFQCRTCARTHPFDPTKENLT